MLEDQCYGERDNHESKTLRNRHNFHEFLERQAHTAIQGELDSQRKLAEAETDMEVTEWERRNSDVALHESQRELESQLSQFASKRQHQQQAMFFSSRVCVDPSTRETGTEREREAVNFLQVSEHDLGTIHLLLVLRDQCYGQSGIKALKMQH